MVQRILLTGSQGLLGGLAVKTLEEKGHDLVLLDKKGKGKTRCDLLYDNLLPYFKGVDTIFHFAAHAGPAITLRQAEENFLMIWNVLEACRKEEVKRVIYASSLHVYDFSRLYREGKKIDSATPICPHNPKEHDNAEGVVKYSLSKIMSERLVDLFYKSSGISGLKLRIGAVSSRDLPFSNEYGNAIWLSHEDFGEIVKRAVDFKGLEAVACVSNNSEGFVDLNQLQKVLGYMPKSDSAKLN